MTVLTVAINESDPKRIAAALRQMAEGRTNAIGSCTITANLTSTLVTAPNCSVSSWVFLSPTTSNAASRLASTYTVSANGSFRMVHTNAATTDCTYGFVCLG